MSRTANDYSTYLAFESASKDGTTLIKSRHTLMRERDVVCKLGGGAEAPSLRVNADDFKSVKDEYCPKVADEGLQTVAKDLQTLRGALSCGQRGEETFCVLMRGCTRPVVALTASINERTSMAVLRMHSFTVDIGMAARPWRGQPSEGMRRAHQAWRGAKCLGKSTYRVNSACWSPLQLQGGATA